VLGVEVDHRARPPATGAGGELRGGGVARGAQEQVGRGRGEDHRDDPEQPAAQAERVAEPQGDAEDHHPQERVEQEVHAVTLTRATSANAPPSGDVRWRGAIPAVPRGDRGRGLPPDRPHPVARSAFRRAAVRGKRAPGSGPATPRARRSRRRPGVPRRARPAPPRGRATGAPAARRRGAGSTRGRSTDRPGRRERTAGPPVADGAPGPAREARPLGRGEAARSSPAAQIPL
jgi:hypothetical protein